jgi:hypothetical protein
MEHVLAVKCQGEILREIRIQKLETVRLTNIAPGGLAQISLTLSDASSAPLLLEIGLLHLFFSPRRALTIGSIYGFSPASKMGFYYDND